MSEYKRKENLMNYYNATICLNGHVVDKRIANAQKYCSTCGKETYSLCSNCGQIVKDSMGQLLLDVACEVAKKLLFPQ